uniref:THAP domain-containing protein 1-like n=1 Tax=Styela clava TaxID=7725 RepID=UPI001939881A|nr:THAP domain-containing protein 1-like [Styela clava]
MALPKKSEAEKMIGKSSGIGTQCSAYGCRKRFKRKDFRSDSEGDDDEESVLKRKYPRTFHKFPLNKALCEKWVTALRRANWIPTSSSRLCSDHFKESDIKRTGQRTRIKDNAVPTRFKAFPKYLRKVNEQRKSPTKRKFHSCVKQKWSVQEKFNNVLHDHSYSQVIASPTKLKN